jgi:hypothetical protein
MKVLTQDDFLDYINKLGISDRGEKLTNTIPHIIIYEIDFYIVGWIELHDDEHKYIIL